MRRSLIALVLISSGLLAGGEAPPRLEVTQTTADIGKRFAGEQVPIVYELRNVGGSPLLISNVGAGCGCLAPQRKWPERVAPGAAGRIELTVDTRDLTGTATHPLTIFSNDPENPKVSLWIKAEVERVFSVEPRALAFGEVADGSAPSPRRLRIRPVAEGATLSSPECADKRFAVRLLSHPEGGWELEATLAGPLAYGMNAAEIRISTNHPGLRSLVVEASAWRPLPVQAVPPRIVIGVAPLAQPQRRQVLVRSAPGAAWTVRSVRCSDATVKTSLQPVAEGQTRIVVDLPGGFSVPTEAPCVLHLECQGPGESQMATLEVPVMAGG